MKIGPYVINLNFFNTMGLRQVSVGATNTKKSAAAGETLVVCPVPARFFLGHCIYTGAITPWLQLHDTAAVPADQAVPLMIAKMQDTGNAWIEVVTGVPMDHGITLVLSSTKNTYTAIGSNDGIFFGTFH